MESLSAYAVIGWLSLHVSAIILAWATRMADGWRLEPIVQFGFLGVMTLLGASAWVAREIEIELWPVPAVTLMIMVLTAVVDLRRGDSPSSASALASR